MDTLLLAMILALGLDYSTVRSQDPTLDTDNADVQNLICKKHNDFRRNVDPPASNMQRIEWSKEAAENAKKVAAKCVFEHSSAAERTISTSSCGENLAIASGMFLSWDGCMQLWFDEQKYFLYGTGLIEEGKQVGHYTQVVWDKSARIGCAFQKCPEFGLYVCHYAPQGNIGIVITHPYEQGTPCSKCPNNCDNKLCTNSCLYLDGNPDCPNLESYCSQDSMSSVCQATCRCGKRSTM